MKVVFFKWNSLCNEDILEAFGNLKIDVHEKEIMNNLPRRDPEKENEFERYLSEIHPDFVFTFNFFPIVATVCNKLNIKYVSWVYDSPHVTLYSYTIIHPTNYCFIFDRAEYLKFANQGIKTVHYLPLAANAKRIDSLIDSSETSFHTDISFVGSLYNEEKKQLKNLKVSPDGIETVEWLKEEYVVNRKKTSDERIRLLNFASMIGETTLFTGSDMTGLDKRIINGGLVDYYTEAPFVYRNSTVNLCMTLKSIKTGIPLRAFEIMASKGALLMTKQTDMDDFFIPGVDYFVYENDEDFMRKVRLMMDMDLTDMRESAFLKVSELCTYEKRINEILNCL